MKGSEIPAERSSREPVTEDEPNHHPSQMLRPDGTLAPGANPDLTPAQLLEAMRWLFLWRAYDERAMILQRQGRFGVFSEGFGQEAAVIGSSMALDVTRDWVVPQYRELVAYVRQGYPLESIAASFMGNPLAGRIPYGVRLLPPQVAIAAQLPHAVGLAWGLQLQGLTGVVLVYFGDGGSSEGDFHEAINLAGVLKAPAIFFMQNNQWAISTPRRLQSAAHSFATRARGYGIEGAAVDGNDLLAVYAATRAAVERARAGEGPTLIEAVTYRLGSHNTSDNPSAYASPQDQERALALEPLPRLRSYLVKKGLWDDEMERDLLAASKREVEAAMDAARSLPGPGPSYLFENIYATLPDRVAEQRRVFLAESV